MKQLSEDPLLLYVRGQEMILIEVSGVEIHRATEIPYSSKAGGKGMIWVVQFYELS